MPPEKTQVGISPGNADRSVAIQTKSAKLAPPQEQWIIPCRLELDFLDWSTASIPVACLPESVEAAILADSPDKIALPGFKCLMWMVNNTLLQQLHQGGLLRVEIVKCDLAPVTTYWDCSVFLILEHTATNDAERLRIELNPTLVATKHERDRQLGVLQQQFDIDSRIDQWEAERRFDEGRKKLRDVVNEKIRAELPEVFLHPLGDTILTVNAQESTRLAAWIECRLEDANMPLAVDGQYNVHLLPLARPRSFDERAFLATYTQGDQRTLIDDWLDNLHQHSGVLREPLLTQAVPPPLMPSNGQSLSTSFDRIVSDLDLPEDYRLWNEPQQRIRSVVAQGGTEALAWYQSLHSHDSHSWGIYFHYERLCDLATDLRKHLSEHRFRPADRDLKEFVAGVIREHEMFHAKIDCFAAAQELLGGRAIALPYEKEVYRSLSLTPAWLEEALANYFAWQWAHDIAHGWVQQKRWTKEACDQAIGFIAEIFALSPPGYCHWQAGHDFMSTRTLLAQLTEGTPSPRQPLTRLEDFFTGFCQTTFLKIEIPHYWWTENTGNLDRLFSTPTRREVVRFLNKRGYVHKRTSGSHAIYEGPDGKCFPLPKRDPLSLTVFTSLRQHFGISKQEYLTLRTQV